MTTGNRKPDAATSGFHGDGDMTGGRLLSMSDRQDKAKPPARQVLFVGSRHTASIDADKVLRKNVHSSHMLQKPPAWAFDLAHVEAAERAGCVGVEVFDVDTQRLYRCSWTTFVVNGFRFNRGAGDQVGLTLRFFTVTGPGVSIVVDPEPVHENEPAQLALW